MRNGRTIGVAGVLTTLALLAPSARGQSPSIAGTVTDVWETAVPDANLTLTNSQTRAELKSTTNQAGEYVFSQMTPGRYDLSVRANGFKAYARYKLDIVSEAKGDSAVRLDVRMDREKEDTGANVKELETQVARKRDDYLAHFNLGCAYFAKGQIENALHQFQETVKLQPDHRAARLAMAQMALRVGAPLPALQVTQDMIRLKPDDGAATLIAASALVRMKQPDEAASELDKFLKSDPYDTDALIESGSVNLVRKHYAESEAAYRQAYSLDPSSMRALRGVAEVHLAMKEPDKAVQAVAAEVEKHPERLDLRRELGKTELRAKEYDKALADFLSILEKYQDRPKEQADLYAGIGQAYQGKGDFPRSIENLKKATQMAAENASYVSTLAAVYDASGKSKEAWESYREALKLDPHNPYLMNNAAFLSSRAGGDLDEALRLVQAARRELPDSSEVLDTLGWIYLKKDLVDSACQVFQDLVEKVRTNPTFHYHYALALAQKGDKAAALEQLEQALENKPAPTDEQQIRELIKKLS